MSVSAQAEEERKLAVGAPVEESRAFWTFWRTSPWLMQVSCFVFL